MSKIVVRAIVSIFYLQQNGASSNHSRKPTANLIVNQCQDISPNAMGVARRHRKAERVEPIDSETTQFANAMRRLLGSSRDA